MAEESDYEERIRRLEDAFREMLDRMKANEASLARALQGSSAGGGGGFSSEINIYHAVTGAGGIPAATSATQMSSATVRLWFPNKTGGLTDSGIDVTCWNKSTTGAVGNNKKILMTPHLGGFICIWEEC